MVMPINQFGYASAEYYLHHLLANLGGMSGDSPLPVISPLITSVSAPISGQVTVTVDGTAENGPNVTATTGFYITAHASNTGVIYVGNDGAGDVDSTNGYTLDAGQQIYMPVANMNLLWFDASVAGEKAAWLRA